VVTFVDGTGGLAHGELTVGVPLLAAVVVVAGVRIALPGNGRSVSGVALCLSGALALTGYAAQVSGTPGPLAPVIGSLPLLAVAAVALAANHPSSRDLGRAPHPATTVTAGRVVGVGAALLVSPALILLWTVRNGGNGYLLGGGIGVLTALAPWRLGRLDAERHRARSAAEASEARLRVLLENAADVIAIVDAAGRVTYVSPAVGSLLGRDPADVLGRRALAVVDPDDRARLLHALIATAGGVTDIDVRLRHADGTTRWVEAKVSGRVHAPGVEGWVVNLREVTDRKLLEEELRHRAGSDAFTGLVNRAGFWQRLTRATADVDPASPPAVLFVDLDGFKAVNDTLGHAAGDQLLVAVAGRLSPGVRTGDCVARLGGDEFAVLLGTADDARVRRLADRLLQQLRQPVGLAGHAVTVTASIGGTLAVAGDTPESLLHRADTAMYAAKRDGKDAVELSGGLGSPAGV
jgi:diguanylate cyclase (GGDEF)-like protein/PAS domain S-box-containing protein